MKREFPDAAISVRPGMPGDLSLLVDGREVFRFRKTKQLLSGDEAVALVRTAEVQAS